MPYLDPSGHINGGTVVFLLSPQGSGSFLATTPERAPKGQVDATSLTGPLSGPGFQLWPLS